MSTSPAPASQLDLNPPRSNSPPATMLMTDDDRFEVIPREDASIWYYGFSLMPQLLGVSSNSEPLSTILSRPKKGDWPLDEADAERFEPVQDDVLAAIHAALPQAVRLCIRNIGYSENTARPVCVVLVRPGATEGLNVKQMLMDVSDVLYDYELDDFVIEVPQLIRQSPAREGVMEMKNSARCKSGQAAQLGIVEISEHSQPWPQCNTSTL